MIKKYNIAIVGATGSVGAKILDTLFVRKFPIDNIYAAASSKSIGKLVSYGDDTINVIDVDNLDFSKIDIAFFSVNNDITKQYIKIATNNGCIVIDKSDLFRLDADIPLIIPEANSKYLKDYAKRNIIANPNCCVIPLAVALKPLDNATRIKRIVISTYQSTSGAGKAGMDELYNNTKAKYVFNEIPNNIFPQQIAFNLFPQIGEFYSDGYTVEEQKITLELQKIIGNHIKSTVTCVRVPVFIGHCMSVNVEFHKTIDSAKVKQLLEEAEGVSVLVDDQYATPKDVVDQESVYVSRIRNDHSNNNAINLWITVDNLYKGAALNAVQIAEELISKYL